MFPTSTAALLAGYALYDRDGISIEIRKRKDGRIINLLRIESVEVNAFHCVEVEDIQVFAAKVERAAAEARAFTSPRRR